MKKLIERIKGDDKTFLAYVGQENPHDAPMIIAEMKRQQITDVMQRLEEYEDIGLTPEEVVKLKEMDELAEEIMRKVFSNLSKEQEGENGEL